MKPEELRIGNWVLQYGIKAVQVIKLTKDKIIIDASPILITKEWLIEFGFNENYGEYEKDGIILDCEYTDAGEWIVFMKAGNIKPIESKNEYTCRYYPKSEIKYVHQLQNLYFALTNEELELK